MCGELGDGALRVGRAGQSLRFLLDVILQIDAPIPFAGRRDIDPVRANFAISPVSNRSRFDAEERGGYALINEFVPIIPLVERMVLLAALPALSIPVIILGGIYGGIFTPTEAAGVAVSIYFQDPDGIVLEFAGWQREFGPEFDDQNDTIGATPADIAAYRKVSEEFAQQMAETEDA